MDTEEILGFFKALADPSRLKIVGLLAQQEYTVEQLAALLDLRPSTVSHHLANLAKVRLVSARAESYYNYYRLEKETLSTLAANLLSEENLVKVASAAATSQTDTEAEKYARKIFHNYLLPDGRLRTIPAQRKKLEVILRHLVLAFDPGTRYSEKRVNQILSRFHPDTASLRRELVGARLLDREKGEYWRVADSPLSQEQEMEAQNDGREE